MDEIVVAWGVPPTARDGYGHLVRALRVVTGLDLAPVRGCWSCGSVEHGAPRLAGRWGSYLGCSMTYVADGFVLAAVSLRRRRDGALVRGPLPVGIDAEDVRKAPDLEPSLASRIFSHAEADCLGEAASTREVQRALLTAWTQKEATLKAIGCGLVVDPRNVETDPFSSDRSRVRVRLGLPGADRDFHARAVSEKFFGHSWVVSVVTPDVPRAHRASLRVVHVS